MAKVALTIRVILAQKISMPYLLIEAIERGDLKNIRETLKVQPELAKTPKALNMAGGNAKWKALNGQTPRDVTHNEGKEKIERHLPRVATRNI
jgi:hypothetical protein